MLSELKKGDDVVTQGGIIGKDLRDQGQRDHAAGSGGRAPAVLRSAVTGLYTAARRPAEAETIRAKAS